MSGPAPREWDAAAYDDLVLPHEGWGRGVLDRMRLRGDERVLDAGCGTGRDAAALRARWPGVSLVLLDGSQRMLDRARERLGEGPEYVRADLARPVPLERPVDAVMSVAAFHWVEDHAALFAHLAAVMRPGARLTSDCGGRGNLARFAPALEEVLSARGAPPEDPWEFADEQQTRARLGAAGFEVEDVRLRPDPFGFEDRGELERFLGVVVLGSHLAGLPAGEHRSFVAEVADAVVARGPMEVDYVRLEVDAVRR